MNETKPETPRELVERTLQAARRVNAIKNGYIKDRQIEAEANALGIDEKQFRLLLHRD